MHGPLADTEDVLVRLKNVEWPALFSFLPPPNNTRWDSVTSEEGIWGICARPAGEGGVDDEDEDEDERDRGRVRSG